MTPITKKIGEALQSQRKKKHLTQQELSEKIGISEKYLSAVERGVNALSYDLLVAAMNVLECSADDIFGEVITHGLTVKACELNEQLCELDAKERARILAVLETLILTAKQK